MNYLAVVQYDGTDYFGFQVQTKQPHPTIQKALEDAIERLTGKRVRIAPSGRTDRGVHARAQTVTFELDTAIPVSNLATALNTYLPAAINVDLIKVVPAGFHARFSCKEKTYRYIIDTRVRVDVFNRNYVWHIPQELDVSAMDRAASLLTGTHDFRSFALSAGKYKTCVRTVRECRVSRNRDRVVIHITADGFLQGMVRNIVGVLVEVGKGKRHADDVMDIIRAKDRSSIGMAAPAGGLYLWSVRY